VGYSALEHFLGDLEALRVAAPLGDALMQRYLEVWPVPAEGSFFYLDNRRKVHYSSYPLAAGKISASDRVLGATTQLFLHDAAGHGLHMHSGPGDDHMTRTLEPFAQRFVPLIGRDKVRGIVADQEMRSVALFVALEAMDHLGFVTMARTPTPKQEAAFEVEGIFVPYLRDAESGELTHWVAHAHTLLQDRQKGLSYPCEVTLVVDCRSGLPGRLIPVLHNLREEELPAEVPHTVYVGRWQNQERVFRDMRACQNLDANYGHKKVLVPNRRVERKREELQHKLHTWDKRVATAQRKTRIRRSDRNSGAEGSTTADRGPGTMYRFAPAKPGSHHLSEAEPALDPEGAPGCQGADPADSLSGETASVGCRTTHLAAEADRAAKYASESGPSPPRVGGPFFLRPGSGEGQPDDLPTDGWRERPSLRSGAILCRYLSGESGRSYNGPLGLQSARVGAATGAVPPCAFVRLP
jgi:hypothetical protein